MGNTPALEMSIIIFGLRNSGHVNQVQKRTINCDISSRQFFKNFPGFI